MNKSAKFRRLVAFLHDVIAGVLAWFFAFSLRFNFDIPAEFSRVMLTAMPFVILVQATIFQTIGLYRGVWRFASVPDLIRISKALALSALLIAFSLFMANLEISVPRSVLVLNPMLLLFLMGGSRLFYRTIKDSRFQLSRIDSSAVLIVGAGETAISLLRELERSSSWRVVGLLDESKSLHGRHILGVPVLGDVSRLVELSEKMKVKQVILALPAAATKIRHSVLQEASTAGITIFTVPSLEDLMSGTVNVTSIRKVDVEDLLGREPVMLDNAGLHQMLEQRVVMVTGAGGSIGSELCRQIVRYKPTLLVLYELSELALYQLEQEFSLAVSGVRFAYVIGDVKDQARVLSVIEHYHPSVVLHAAAYKHVPMMENINAGEALRNNVIGTLSVAKACVQSGVDRFVLISTDKAVNPTNVMGATKRLAEMVCQGLQGVGHTKLLMVRFGNVLGSSGSVIPKFREQIANGGPVTVTHPEITRYFMSIPEAAQLVLQAGLMGRGGEIFVLDMGEPVRIADLAREMIQLSGFTEEEIKITYSGLRPGEKLYEELLADDEHTLPTPHPKLRIAQARSVDETWVNEVVEWIGSNRLDEFSVKHKLQVWVSEYQPANHFDSPHMIAPGSEAIH